MSITNYTTSYAKYQPKTKNMGSAASTGSAGSAAASGSAGAAGSAAASGSAGSVGSAGTATTTYSATFDFKKYANVAADKARLLINKKETQKATPANVTTITPEDRAQDNICISKKKDFLERLTLAGISTEEAVSILNEFKDNKVTPEMFQSYLERPESYDKDKQSISFVFEKVKDCLRDINEKTGLSEDTVKELLNKTKKMEISLDDALYFLGAAERQVSQPASESTITDEDRDQEKMNGGKVLLSNGQVSQPANDADANAADKTFDKLDPKKLNNDKKHAENILAGGKTLNTIQSVKGSIQGIKDSIPKPFIAYRYRR